MILEPETYEKIELTFRGIRSSVVGCISWQVVLSILGIVSALALFLIGHFGSWILCWYLVRDFLLIIASVFFVAVISSSVQNLWEFYQYEKRKLKYQMKDMIKDVYLEAWDDAKYIPYVDMKQVKRIFCSDVYKKKE